MTIAENKEKVDGVVSFRGVHDFTAQTCGAGGYASETGRHDG
jgi:hypothetical protein